MATNGIDSATSALVMAAMNGGTAFTITPPLRCLFHSSMRTTDTGTDTEISTSSGYVQKVGSLFSGVALTFAAASAGAPSTQNSNVAATVTNMPASTWLGNTIIDSKFTQRTRADAVTTNLSTTVTSATATGSSLALAVNALNSPQTTWWATLGSSKTVNAGDTVTVPLGSWQTSLA